MTHLLRIYLKWKPSPWDDDPHEGWGEFSVIVMVQDNQTLLFHWEWSLDDLAEWFYENQYAIRHETLGKLGCEPSMHESISQAIDRCYMRDRSEFPDEDRFLDWVDNLRLFKERHSLRRALAGARIPAIMIGYNHEEGEISFTSKHATPEGVKLWGANYAHDWSYAFDMEDFCLHFELELINFLKDWSRNTDNKIALERAAALTAKLLSAT